MTDLLDCIRIALAEGATPEQKQAGAAACCAAYAALSPSPGLPISVPHVPRTSTCAFSRLRRRSRRSGAWACASPVRRDCVSAKARALRWREDVDLVSGYVTVNQQWWKGQEGTPKGRTRRTIPMTDTLVAALKALDVVRTGYVIRNLDGTPLRDAQTSHATYQICRRAGRPEKGGHTLRHALRACPRAISTRDSGPRSCAAPKL